MNWPASWPDNKCHRLDATGPPPALWPALKLFRRAPSCSLQLERSRRVAQTFCNISRAGICAGRRRALIKSAPLMEPSRRPKVSHRHTHSRALVLIKIMIELSYKLDGARLHLRRRRRRRLSIARCRPGAQILSRSPEEPFGRVSLGWPTKTRLDRRPFSSHFAPLRLMNCRRACQPVSLSARADCVCQSKASASSLARIATRASRSAPGGERRKLATPNSAQRPGCCELKIAQAPTHSASWWLIGAD